MADTQCVLNEHPVNAVSGRHPSHSTLRVMDAKSPFTDGETKTRGGEETHPNITQNPKPGLLGPKAQVHMDPSGRAGTASLCQEKTQPRGSQGGRAKQQTLSS